MDLWWTTSAVIDSTVSNFTEKIQLYLTLGQLIRLLRISFWLFILFRGSNMECGPPWNIAHFHINKTMRLFHMRNSPQFVPLWREKKAFWYSLDATQAKLNIPVSSLLLTTWAMSCSASFCLPTGSRVKPRLNTTNFCTSVKYCSLSLWWTSDLSRV